MVKNQRAPIDGLLLFTSDVSGTVFVQTDQLDGETDWKVREAIRFTQSAMQQNVSSVFNGPWNALVEAPNDLIYDFKGNFNGPNNAYESLRINHTVWANMKITTGEVVLLTIYTGKETRMALNSKKAQDKFGRTDEEINGIFKIIFLILIVVSVTLFLMAGEFSSHWLINIVRIFAILSTLLPFMLKLNVDVAKLFYCRQISQDPHIEGTIVRNRQIPEELGRIEYLLSDKTGTLTRNEMIFKHLRTQHKFYSTENFHKLQDEMKNASQNDDQNGVDKKDRVLTVRECLASMILCNNVSPTFNNGERTLQASSPDEVALVDFAESLGFYMEDRGTTTIKMKTPLQAIETYEILENFAFSSERKRMGILLKNTETGELTFFLKGADIVIQPLLSTEEEIFVKEQTEDLSKEGLRTLVLAQKSMTEEEYNKWKDTMARASQNLRNRVEAEQRCIEELEAGIKLLGVTGVEDLLQKDVKSVITDIRAAGIKVWMLTGDKLETAKCIAISTGFKAPNQNFWEVSETNETKINELLTKFDPDMSVLLISGQTLEIIMRNEFLKEEFLKKSIQAESVVLCRCAPKQKAEVATILKEEMKKVVCGIGDGGNDVGMIQSANIGIGIEGKEGRQASLASDFSVREFKNILKLFLWHGRLSYLRSSTLGVLVVHRGFIQTTIQYLFMIAFQFVTVNVYNGYLNMFYGTLFTNIVVFSMIFDVDIPLQQAFNYPQLYKLLQESGELSVKTLFVWIWKAIFQGAVIILLTLKFFENTFLEFVTITFTALVLVEYLTIITIVRTWHVAMFVGIAVSFVAYLLCLHLLKRVFQFSDLDVNAYLKIVLLVICGWAPLQLIQLVQRACFPTPVDKIIQEGKTKEKRARLSTSLRKTQLGYI